MKFAYKIGDTVTVTKGKFSGKEAAVVKIDKKNKRVQLEGLKKDKLKTKGGSLRDIHGTFSHAHLKLVTKEEPKKEEAASEAPAEDKAEDGAKEQKSEEQGA